jgi:2-keto-4-pentenoate hydratase/2-oxohepta-3-ene-1,7-dioic acid hydratase in catechol pathway
VEKFVRFSINDKVSYGLVKDDKVVKLEGSQYEDFRPSHIEYALSDVKLLAPCVPSKIIGMGQNYGDIEIKPDTKLPKDPLYHVGPASAILDPGEDILKLPMTKELFFEAELAIVIGKKAHLVPLEEAQEYIWGYTVTNDVTAKDVQRQDVQWTRCKSFNTFQPIGPCIVRGIDANRLDIFAYKNGELVQKGNSSDLIFGIDYLVSFISHCMPLLPGDIIVTGTPGGNGGPLEVNDTIEIEIEHIGRLTNYCKEYSGPWNLK